MRKILDIPEAADALTAAILNNPSNLLDLPIAERADLLAAIKAVRMKVIKERLEQAKAALEALIESEDTTA